MIRSFRIIDYNDLRLEHNEQDDQYHDQQNDETLSKRA